MRENLDSLTPRQREVWEVYHRLGSTRKAAEELGIHHSGVTTAIARAKAKLNLPAGVHDAAEATGLDLETMHSGWVKTPATEDAPAYSTYFQVPKVSESASLEQFMAEALEALKDYQPPVFPVRPLPKGEHLLVVDLADVHIGKLCVASETGFSYDRDIAIHRMIEGTRGLLRRAEVTGVGRILFVIGNDILHVDGPRSTTTSGTYQDSHGSIFQMHRDALVALVQCIEACALVAPVDLVFIPSNHDWVMGWTLAQSIAAWFRSHPGVTASTYNISERHRKYYRFERNLIGLSHGDGAKEKDLLALMVAEAKGHMEAPHRYWYIHHFHHKVRNRVGSAPQKLEKDHTGMTLIANGPAPVEGDNIEIEYVRSPSPPDSWHDRQGYVNRQGVECFLHHPIDGQVARFTEWM